MEFKDQQLLRLLPYCFRINRNIMEFKGEQDRSCLGKYKELIET